MGLASEAPHLVNSPPQARLESATREVLAGLVERVTFHNAENRPRQSAGLFAYSLGVHC